MMIFYTDGASRGNPGRASYGFVMYDTDIHTPVYTEAMYLGTKTNNEAEYSAVVRAMEKFCTLGIAQARVYLDSELVVKQLKGIYKIKQPHLQHAAQKIKQLIAQSNVEFIHIPRAQNAVADALANYALDHAKTPGTVFKNVLLS